jgi:hypothetical protein
MADLISIPIHLFWATPKTRGAKADCIINPSGDNSYYSNDNAILLCCEKDLETNQPIFVLLKKDEQQPTEEATLRFALNSEEELSFEFEDDMTSPYALWFYQKGSHETDLYCNFELENDFIYSAPCVPEHDKLYFIYPTDPTRTLLLPFPQDCRLYVFAKLANGNVQYVSEVVSHDIYVYFALPEQTLHVLCLTDSDQGNAMRRLL